MGKAHALATSAAAAIAVVESSANDAMTVFCGCLFLLCWRTGNLDTLVRVGVSIDQPRPPRRPGAVCDSRECGRAWGTPGKIIN